MKRCFISIFIFIITGGLGNCGGKVAVRVSEYLRLVANVKVSKVQSQTGDALFGTVIISSWTDGRTRNPQPRTRDDASLHLHKSHRRCRAGVKST